MDLQNTFEKKQFLRRWKACEILRDAAFDRLQRARYALRGAPVMDAGGRSQLEAEVKQARMEYYPDEHAQLRDMARAQGFRVAWDRNSDTYDLVPLPKLTEDEDVEGMEEA